MGVPASRTWDLDYLIGMAARVFAARGVPPAVARSAAKALVQAEVAGIGTHGLSRISQYCALLDSGRLEAAALPAVIRSHGATALVDAGHGLAYAACELAVDTAVALARRYGAAFVGVTRSSHAGALGLTLEPVADAGLVGLAFSNAPAAMPLWGGTSAVLGTNPVAACFPRPGQDPIVVDMAMTSVTRGQILEAARAGQPIPEDWALDAAGQPTTDAEAALAGTLFPAGGVKGNMLALTFELLCTALTGAALSAETRPFYEVEGTHASIGQAFLAIDPGALAGASTYVERVDAFVVAAQASGAARLPGARRFALRRAAVADGVALSPALLAQLEQLLETAP
ncbi:Ldh family oxidoreductase [Xylophilus sp.]|uniref:Ldh family oxidoreductase n=1 Tax=Xylophilus sp. TaxID=2653893 RepID=UPI0013BA7514|nr:Ldh family oxidoreductase [Xylophilus sp.]KAF1050191.1 MAG: (2R)-3-sulfolactate dehydrogenase (NADP(+)) [Xylophilus sp.]